MLPFGLFTRQLYLESYHVSPNLSDTISNCASCFSYGICYAGWVKFPCDTYDFNAGLQRVFVFKGQFSDHVQS